MSKYFLVTGLTNGEPIDPFIYETDGYLPYIECHGDCARYVEPITQEKVIQLLKENRNIDIY